MVIMCVEGELFSMFCSCLLNYYSKGLKKHSFGRKLTNFCDHEGKAIMYDIDDTKEWIHDIDEEYPAVICAMSNDDCSLNEEGSRSCREFSYISKYLQQTVEDTIVDNRNDNESVTCSEPPLSNEKDEEDVEELFKLRLRSAKSYNVRRSYSGFIINDRGDIKKEMTDEEFQKMLRIEALNNNRNDHEDWQTYWDERLALLDPIFK